MRYWVVKGRPSENDWNEMLQPGNRDRWHTFRLPKSVATNDRIFFWESSPGRRLIALGYFTDIECGNDPDYGDTLFEVEYLTRRLKSPLTITELRGVSALQDASFLKSGPAGTVFPLTQEQADALLAVLASNNPEVITTWPDVQVPSAWEEDDYLGVLEGDSILSQHFRRERNQAIILAKKKEVIDRTRTLACEVCGFDFEQVYGSIGEGFCEVHHINPLSEANGKVETTLDDLAVLCSNCHRMIHRLIRYNNSIPSIGEAKRLLLKH